MHSPAYQSAWDQLNQLDPSNLEDMYQMATACVAVSLFNPQKALVLPGITSIYMSAMRHRRIFRWHGGAFGMNAEYIRLLDRIHNKLDEDAVVQRVPEMRRAMERIHFFKSFDSDFG